MTDDPAEARRSSPRSGRRLAMVLALCLVLGVGAGGFAWKREHDKASSQERLAVARLLALHAAELRDTDPVKARKLGAAAVALHADEQTRAGLTDTLLMWRRAHLAEPTPTGVQAMALSADGRIALTKGTDGVSVLDLRTWLDPDITEKADRLAVLKGLEEVTAVALSADGRTALIGGDDGSAIVWDLTDPARPVRGTTLEGRAKGGAARKIALSGDGRTALVADDDGDLLVWNLADRSRPVRSSVIEAGHDGVQDLALSGEGRTAVTVGERGSTVVWNLADPKHPVRSADPAFPGSLTEALGMSGDGRIALVAGAERVRAWDLHNPADPGETGGMDVPDVTQIALTPDGRRALLGTSLGDGFLWDLSRPARPVRLAALKGNTEDVDAVALSADSRVALMADPYRGIFLWDLHDLDRVMADPLGAMCSQAGGGDPLTWEEWTRFAGDADWTRYGGDASGVLSVCSMR
ncbi:WD40 repeat domain-containing protein [Nonomuraea sp. NPDC001699]